jgi:hypothetical protein
VFAWPPGAARKPRRCVVVLGLTVVELEHEDAVGDQQFARRIAPRQYRRSMTPCPWHHPV